jgi:hypothetical protein
VGKSLIVDLPLARFAAPETLEPEERGARELAQREEQGVTRYCTEARPSGRRCPWPAMEGKTRCERHEVWHRDVTVWTGMPYPDGPIGVQEALGVALSRMLSECWPAERARVVADLCRLMISNMRNCEREMAQAERNR